MDDPQTKKYNVFFKKHLCWLGLAALWLVLGLWSWHDHQTTHAQFQQVAQQLQVLRHAQRQQMVLGQHHAKQTLMQWRLDLLGLSLQTSQPCAAQRLAKQLSWLGHHLPLQQHPSWRPLAKAIAQETTHISDVRACVWPKILNTTQQMLHRLYTQHRPATHTDSQAHFLGVDWSPWVKVRTRSTPLTPSQWWFVVMTIQRMQWAARVGQDPLFHQLLADLKQRGLPKVSPWMTTTLSKLEGMHVGHPPLHLQPVIAALDRLIQQESVKKSVKMVSPSKHRGQPTPKAPLLPNQAALLKKMHDVQQKTISQGVFS